MRSKHAGAFLSVLILPFQTNILLYVKVHQLVYEIQYIQGVSGGIVNILGDGSMDYSE